MQDMTSNVEYRSVIKFLILRQTESSSIIEQLQEAYGDVCPSRATIYNWIREFRHGRQSVFNADKEGRSIEISAEKHVLCDKIIVSERRISIRELAQSLHISRGSTETILKDLGIRKLCSRFVPKFLSAELQDNASIHTSNTSTGTLDQCGFQVLQHPPYSPDLAPSDFALFSYLKKQLRGHQFTSVDDL